MPDAIYPYPDISACSPGLARAVVALSQLGAVETSSNRGPQVDSYIRESGGTLSKRPPWCAYFVTWCGSVVEGSGVPICRVRSGAARSHWQRSDEAIRITREELREAVLNDAVVLTGAVFVRARTKTPQKRAHILAGKAAAGHTGIVIDAYIEDELVVLECVAGNSSGAGHSRNSGMVARERIKEGSKAWSALVGVVLA